MYTPIEQRTARIEIEVDFDDLIALECVKEVLEEKIKDSDSWEDQKVMREWKSTIGHFLSVVDSAIMED